MLCACGLPGELTSGSKLCMCDNLRSVDRSSCSLAVATRIYFVSFPCDELV